MEIRTSLQELDTKLSDYKGALYDWSRYYLGVHKERYIFEYDFILSQYKGKGKIVEVGSAPYHMTYLLSRTAGLSITGIDVNPERHQAFLENEKLDILTCDIENERLPLADNSVEMIVFNEVFEHLRINPIQTLKDIHRVLLPGGILILSTPNLYALNNIRSMIKGKGFDNPYAEFLKLETQGHMGHVREYAVSQVQEFLENTGYELQDVLLKDYHKHTGYSGPLFNFITKIIPQLRKVQIHLATKPHSV